VQLAWVTARVKVCVVLKEFASITRTAKDCVPAAVGVPVIIPVLANINPDGSDPESKDHA
jgi:hypothetical protein